MSREKEFTAKIYEEELYKLDSAVASAKIVQMKEDRVVAVIQFRYPKNFFKKFSPSCSCMFSTLKIAI